MINKTLSIIITNHNRCPMLNYVLDTLIETNIYSNVELILIDDCSEQPIQKLEYYKGFIKYYRNDKNMGIGYTRQKGLELASGKYIVYIDADDIPIENYINIILEWLDSNKDIYNFYGMSYPDRDVFDLKASCVCNVYRRKFLLDNNIKFSNERNGEDLYFYDEIIKHNPKIEEKRCIMFYYNKIINSLSHAGYIHELWEEK